MLLRPPISFFFFFNDTATTEIYTLSLHDALPILSGFSTRPPEVRSKPRISSFRDANVDAVIALKPEDRKSTRLNSSHLVISYAVFCLKKKNISVSTCTHHT